MVIAVNVRMVFRLLGFTVLGFSVIALIPGLYALATHTDGFLAFIGTAVFALVLSRVFAALGIRAPTTISIRELFLFTTSLWTTIAVIAAIPVFILIEDVDYAGAIFEAASALSTTGATVIEHLGTRPGSILLWRSILQLFGGVGFVMIAVLILPSFAAGGMNLFRTESSSFDGAKITPHVKTMAGEILLWNFIMLILCIICFIAGGLDVFLAVNAAMCTVSTGGMMPLDSSMNGLPEIIHYLCILFMFLASLPFLIMVPALTGNFRRLLHDQQIRGFVKMIIFLTAAITASLIYFNDYEIEHAFRVALFNVVSTLSSTGFNLEDFSGWNPFASIVFLFILGFGGCSGSTSGGIKIFRLQICASMVKAQFVHNIHPHSVIYPRFNNNRVDSDTLRAIITYFVAYIVCVCVSSTLATLLGLNITDAITATVTCLSNIGPAMGPELNPNGNFAALSPALHTLFAIDMLLGRLEIIPVLLIFVKTFWK